MKNWKPTASIQNLKARAKIIAQIRDFFAKRNVVEVDTPIMCHASVTDTFIHSIEAHCPSIDGSKDKTYYLQTSPEYGMKRLLAAGSGPIYQICKSFRNNEIGSHHNPEFSMLEWYQPGFNHHDLINEVDEFLQFILKTKSAIKLSYEEAFNYHLQINPHAISAEDLRNIAIKSGVMIPENIDHSNKDLWLQLLMSDYIEPRLNIGIPVFIYDYPSTQAALSKICHDDPPIAERFEAYFKGLELANGFHELTDSNEQRKRFENDLIKRNKLGYPEVPIDNYFLDALSSGLPDCAGVAIGIDRLIMMALNENHIENVLSFTIENA